MFLILQRLMTQNHYYMVENFWLQLQCSHVASPKISKNKHFVNAVLISSPWPIAWANKASWMKCEPKLETSPFFKTQVWPFIKDLSNVSSNQPTWQTYQTDYTNEVFLLTQTFHYRLGNKKLYTGTGSFNSIQR